MARIRSIKPEFFTSLTIADLPISARLTFIGLWTYVDDNGVGLADPRLIRAAIWPLEEAPDILQRTREDLRSLQENRLVTFYEASGKALLAITNWSEHQKVSHPRKPRYPRPEQVLRDAETPSDQQNPNPPDDSGNPPEDFQRTPETIRPEQGAGSREQGAGKEEESEPSASDDAPPRTDVERICRHLAAVIEKGGSKKPAITKKWRSDIRLLLDKDGVTPDQAIAAIDWAHTNDFWQAHILSPAKLRQKYDTLRRQAVAEQRKRTPGPRTSPRDLNHMTEEEKQRALNF
ncbi:MULTISPECIES: hypothetical protein [Streptomyces]|uniref:Phage replication protein O n=1 Tax=Streptomyces fradiae ATCC 10745 = DSM 40063 TaxID=1319510 RepID=A0A1Y2NSA8_STRFR|nr:MULTISPECIES: hypothetical protein [Streptomyces]OSY50412.1 hypothetical protein BG846_03988 [Streptomyces fradiae ATCC 10745 = DSM 40063]QEV11665.1 hypothetical protein CP974_06150 [Streptomyces fradiae ATCC 10745 = DSM 40063]